MTTSKKVILVISLCTMVAVITGYIILTNKKNNLKQAYNQMLENTVTSASSLSENITIIDAEKCDLTENKDKAECIEPTILPTEEPAKTVLPEPEDIGEREDLFQETQETIGNQEQIEQ